ncbi:MAG: hypothetical protein ACLUDU_11960 [Butyricimonas faecihominis]
MQFSPEGGNLLSGNFQQVAFKAIGLTGEPWRPREKCIKIRL